jgi:hypothetical protein
MCCTWDVGVERELGDGRGEPLTRERSRKVCYYPAVFSMKLPTIPVAFLEVMCRGDVYCGVKEGMNHWHLNIS